MEIKTFLNVTLGPHSWLYQALGENRQIEAYKDPSANKWYLRAWVNPNTLNRFSYKGPFNSEADALAWLAWATLLIGN